MIYRKIELFIKNWIDSPSKKALLITGARQVGKTFSIRKTLKENAASFVEINFLENSAALQLFQQTIMRPCSPLKSNREKIISAMFP